MTYCCLIIGPATLGQYVDLQPSAFEKNLKFKGKWCIITNITKLTFTNLLLRSRFICLCLDSCKFFKQMSALVLNLMCRTWWTEGGHKLVAHLNMSSLVTC